MNCTTCLFSETVTDVLFLPYKCVACATKRSTFVAHVLCTKKVNILPSHMTCCFFNDVNFFPQRATTLRRWEIKQTLSVIREPPQGENTTRAHTLICTYTCNPTFLLCWQLYWWKEYWERSSVIHCPGRQISSKCQYPQLLTTATISHSEHLSTPAVKHT